LNSSGKEGELRRRRSQQNPESWEKRTVGSKVPRREIVAEMACQKGSTGIVVDAMAPEGGGAWESSGKIDVHVVRMKVCKRVLRNQGLNNANCSRLEQKYGVRERRRSCRSRPMPEASVGSIRKNKAETFSEK